MTTPICPIHKLPMRLIPAGISRKTGKPYSAFWACQERGCNYKPPLGGGTPFNLAQFEQMFKENTERIMELLEQMFKENTERIMELHKDKKELIAKNVALTNAINFLSQTLNRPDTNILVVENSIIYLADKFLDWLKKEEKSVQKELNKYQAN
jgi:hypothetical protein